MELTEAMLTKPSDVNTFRSQRIRKETEIDTRNRHTQQSPGDVTVRSTRSRITVMSVERRVMK